MTPFRYTVSARFAESHTAQAWIAWMRDEHLAAVIQTGALHGEVVRLDGDQLHFEARYQFAGRADFDRYVRDHAPRLRAEGLRRFPGGEVVHYERTSGEVLLELQG